MRIEEAHGGRLWDGASPRAVRPSPVPAEILRLSGRGNCKETIFALKHLYDSCASRARMPMATAAARSEARSQFLSKFSIP